MRSRGDLSFDAEVKMHKHILICGDNINSLNVLRSLGEKGITPITILQDEGHLRLVSTSQYVGEIVHVQSMKGVLPKLMEYKDELFPPFVYLTDDNHLQLLDGFFDALKGHFFFFNAGEQGRLTFFLDKDQQCKLARECGFSVPEFEEVERGQLPVKLSYPVITKTSNSYSPGWKRDVTICSSPEELVQAYSTMISERLLLQEYVEKTGEYSMQGISIDGGKEVFMPFERMYLRFSRTSFGGYMYYQPFCCEELQNKVQSMLLKIGFTGCFEIEFLVDKKQKLHFLEINFRFSASNYGINTGGVNLPYLWSRSTLSHSIDHSDLTIRNKRYYVINDITDWKSSKQVGYLVWMKQLLTADGYYLFNKKDIRPFFCWWFQKLKSLYCKKNVK